MHASVVLHGLVVLGIDKDCQRVDGVYLPVVVFVMVILLFPPLLYHDDLITVVELLNQWQHMV